MGARPDSRRLGLQQQVVHVSGQQGVLLTLKLLQTSICVWVACLLALCAACMVWCSRCCLRACLHALHMHNSSLFGLTAVVQQGVGRQLAKAVAVSAPVY